MDQGPDKSKSPSTSYRETFRRHRKLFCLPVILGALAAIFFVVGAVKTYNSTANLWIDTASSVPSSVGETSTALTQPPASAEQGLLSELLTTRRFAASVDNSLLGKSLGSPDAIRDNAQGLLANGQLAQSVLGNQVLQLSYSASSPTMAQSVLGAVIAQLGKYGNRLTSEHNQAAVAYDTAQVKAAETALATARSNVAAYQAQHPGFSRADPNYVALVAAQNNAATQVTQANTALSQVTGTGNGNDWSIQVIDPPSEASSAPLGKKKTAEIILGGALGGLLVSFLAIVALTPAKKEAWEDELPTGGPFGSKLPPADPFRAGPAGVPTAAPSPRATDGVGQHRLSLGDRRFQFRTRSAPTEEP